MEYDCDYFSTENVTLPNVEQQFRAFGFFGLLGSILGAVISIFLIGLFILNVVNIIQKEPSQRRRLLVWITSLPMVVSLLSVTTMLVPRSGNLCETVKNVYIPFLMMHFVDLTLQLEGGEKEALKKLTRQRTPLNLCMPPCCYIGICFRNCTFGKRRLRFLRGLVYQMPLLQLVIIVVQMILTDAEIIETGKNVITSVLAVINFLVFVFGIWSSNVIIQAFKFLIKWRRYLPKARILMTFIGLMKMQNFILVIITNQNAMGCLPPYVSPLVMRRTIDAFITLMESLIFGIVFYLVYRIRNSERTDGQNEPEKENTADQLTFQVTSETKFHLELAGEETDV